MPVSLTLRGAIQYEKQGAWGIFCLLTFQNSVSVSTHQSGAFVTLLNSKFFSFKVQKGKHSSQFSLKPNFLQDSASILVNILWWTGREVLFYFLKINYMLCYFCFLFFLGGIKKLQIVPKQWPLNSKNCRIRRQLQFHYHQQQRLHLAKVADVDRHPADDRDGFQRYSFAETHTVTQHAPRKPTAQLQSKPSVNRSGLIEKALPQPA